MSRWMFAAVSPGGAARMDLGVAHVVRSAARSLRADPDAERWFFLRYFDRRGPHLRLRVRAVDRDGLDRVQRRLWPVLQDGVRAARDADGAAARTTLLPAPPHLELPDGDHVGVEHRVYEPELRKYGGPEGTAIAEELFEASSDAVLALDGERLGRVDRAALAVALMQAAGRSLPADERAAFWDGYAAWWCGRERRPQAYPALRRGMDGAADRARPTLLARARAGAAAGATDARRGDARRDATPSATSTSTTPTSALDAYAAAVARMLRAAADAGVDRDVPHLCFHHVHMTNNRLGITLTEEALLGAVLSGAAQEDLA